MFKRNPQKFPFYIQSPTFVVRNKKDNEQIQ